jgi:hypothetical protein
MTKTDGRHLKPATLDHLRKQAVALNPSSPQFFQVIVIFTTVMDV